MAKDTWYKRLGWFLFYSAITLIIFFVIDLIVQKVVSNYENSHVEAYFVDKNGDRTFAPIIITKSEEDLETVKLYIHGSVANYKITVAIDGSPLLNEFENTEEIEFQIPSIPGEYIITCNYHAYPTFGKEQDILLTTKVIVKE